MKYHMRACLFSQSRSLSKSAEFPPYGTMVEFDIARQAQSREFVPCTNLPPCEIDPASGLCGSHESSSSWMRQSAGEVGLIT